MIFQLLMNRFLPILANIPCDFFFKHLKTAGPPPTTFSKFALLQNNKTNCCWSVTFPEQKNLYQVLFREAACKFEDIYM